MALTGIVEGFFGPAWPREKRESFAPFLSKNGGDFFVYAPKQDPNLRKKWRDPWEPSYVDYLKSLASTFQREGIQFGVGLSPFGLGTAFSLQDKEILKAKLTLLQTIGIDLLGLFFDDMPTTENLAATQIEVVKFVRSVFGKKIIFCPSYYSFDPVLDKVFGTRPPRYLEEIASGVPLDVAVIWTGPKVISPEISSEHLREVQALLKRKPFIWENLYANDGPKNCKFLKLKPFSGRGEGTFEEAEGIAFNLMNQPELSKILYLSSLYALNGRGVEEGFDLALSELCSEEFKTFLQRESANFLTLGLDQIDENKRALLLSELNRFTDSAAQEIRDWLEGRYTVGSECLTD
jgi:hyaluronoglucosaminidase